jgi:hypothetical protein
VADLAKLEKALNEALAAFDWPTTDALCAELVESIHQAAQPLSEAAANRILGALRRKQRFECMTSVAEALLRSGRATARVRRQYAQSLIDRKILFAPELVLQGTAQDLSTSQAELTEARGLTGRIYKQLYVNLHTPGAARQRFLERAIGEYLSTYRVDPKANLWPGINAVALLQRAERDGMPLQGFPDPKALAKEILATLEQRETDTADFLPAWDVATALEALVALGRHTEAVDKALEYSLRGDADAFEISSTVRQLEEVWELSESEKLGSKLLPILRATLLKRQGGEIILDPKDIAKEVKRVENARNKAPDAGVARAKFEKVFGEDATRTLEWYKKGLDQTLSIARVERLTGKGHGTGWLVNRADFFAGNSKQKLLVTNAHVISPSAYPNALAPDEARANFQALGEKFDVGEVVFSSPPDELDVTFVALQGPEPPAEPLRVYTNKVKLRVPPQRVYVIGHPGGREIEFSLQDNALLACNDRLLHYRAPTEGGSSGSPVFEDADWRVIALHHAGDKGVQRIDGKPGVYDANEGIAIRAIQQATKKG